MVSPVNNPEIVFVANISADGKLEYDEYRYSYVGYLIKEQLEKDVTAFFPGAYIKINQIKLHLNETNQDFRKMALSEIINESKSDDMNSPECYVDI